MNLFDDIVSVLFPPVCHICGERLPNTAKFVCPECVQSLPRPHYPLYSPRNQMAERFIDCPWLEDAAAFCWYVPDSSVASLVQDFKYRHFALLAKTLGEYMGIIMSSESDIFKGVDAIIPVPLHFLKRWKRGYNQTEMLARGIGEATGIPVWKNLYASRGHRTQTGLSHEKRKANTEGIFAVKRAYELDGKKIILLDDICTTGSTLRSAGNTLAEASEGLRITVMSFGVTHLCGDTAAI